MKKLFLILCMLLTLACAAAAEEFTSGDYTYELLPDGTVEITGYTGSQAELVLPEMLDGKQVTALREWAISCNDALIRVTIPDVIVHVEDTPFDRCPNLAEIEVYSNHPTLMVVDGCLYSMKEQKLVSYPAGRTNTTYVVPHGIEVIGSLAFRGADKLTSITLPGTVTWIGTDAFADCTALESITLGKAVTGISSYAFSGCEGLTSITLPDSLTYMERNVFCRCSSLKDIIVSPDHPLLAVADGVLFNKSDNSLVFYSPVLEAESYEIPQGVTRIEDHAFSGSKAQSIIIPEGVTEIGTGAFESCSALTSLVIPASVTTFGDYVFSGNNSVTLTVTAGSPAETYAIENNIGYVSVEPADDGSWTCSCGAVSTGKFCGECGSAKPESNTNVQSELQCAACGCKPEGVMPKFCPECGAKF